MDCVSITARRYIRSTVISLPSIASAVRNSIEKAIDTNVIFVTVIYLIHAAILRNRESGSAYSRHIHLPQQSCYPFKSSDIHTESRVILIKYFHRNFICLNFYYLGWMASRIARTNAQLIGCWSYVIHCFFEGKAAKKKLRMQHTRYLKCVQSDNAIKQQQDKI